MSEPIVTARGRQHWLVEVRPVRVAQCVGQALTHRWMHGQLPYLLGVEPRCCTGLMMIGLGVTGWGEGVEAHCELLVNPVPVRIGQHVPRIAVQPGER
jgi:hypothetical protein